MGKQIELEKQSVATINRLEVLDSKENEIVMKLNDVAMREDAAEKKVAEIISKENEAKNLGLKKSEERKISKERWRAEDQRAAVEKERWALQKESSDLARQIDSLRCEVEKLKSNGQGTGIKDMNAVDGSNDIECSK